MFIAGALLPALHIARAFRPDSLLVSFGMPTGPVGWVVHKACRIPYVLSLCGSDVPGAVDGGVARLHRLVQPLTRRIWAQAGAVVVLSEGMHELASRSADGRRLEIVPNGVDLQQFTPANVDHIERTTVRLLFVGRLIQQKGVACLLAAVATLPRAMREGVQLEIVGNGPAEASLSSRPAN